MVCAVGAGLGQAVFVTLSPDGTKVYVAAQVSNAVAVFTHNALTGELTQLPGVAGCVSEWGSDAGLAAAVYCGPRVTRGPRCLSIYFSK